MAKMIDLGRTDKEMYGECKLDRNKKRYPSVSLPYGALVGKDFDIGESVSFSGVAKVVSIEKSENRKEVRLEILQGSVTKKDKKELSEKISDALTDKGKGK